MHIYIPENLDPGLIIDKPKEVYLTRPFFRQIFDSSLLSFSSSLLNVPTVTLMTGVILISPWVLPFRLYQHTLHPLRHGFSPHLHIFLKFQLFDIASKWGLTPHCRVKVYCVIRSFSHGYVFGHGIILQIAPVQMVLAYKLLFCSLIFACRGFRLTGSWCCL